MAAGTEFDYYYGDESSQFSFYRIPRQLVTSERFYQLSTDAKLLYGLLLDRMGLSAKNGWYDEAGRVYIYYTLEEIQNDLRCAHGKAVKLLAEFGYIADWSRGKELKELKSSLNRIRNSAAELIDGIEGPGLEHTEAAPRRVPPHRHPTRQKRQQSVR